AVQLPHCRSATSLPFSYITAVQLPRCRPAATLPSSYLTAVQLPSCRLPSGYLTAMQLLYCRPATLLLWCVRRYNIIQLVHSLFKIHDQIILQLTANLNLMVVVLVLQPHGRSLGP